MARAELGAFLDGAAGACEEAIAAYIEAARPGLRFQRQALFTVAVMQGYAEMPAVDDSDVRLVRSAASNLAAVCRTENPNAVLVTVAGTLEAIVAACSQVLRETDAGSARGWRRFAFPDADFDVVRRRQGWLVRRQTAEAEDRTLDGALGQLLHLSSHRRGEIAVQVLDWYSHEDVVDD